MATRKATPTWSDVKTKLADFDRWLWPDVFQNQDTAVSKAKKAITVLPDGQRPPFWERPDEVRRISHNFGDGVGDDMDELLVKHGVNG